MTGPEYTYYMFLAKKWIFSQFLSATIGPSVARVSAPRTTPSLKMIPTIVVPVLIAFGGANPFFSKAAFLQISIWFLANFVNFVYWGYVHDDAIIAKNPIIP